MKYPKGTYFIRLLGDQPFLTEPHSEKALQEPEFVAFEGSPSDFIFEIVTPDPFFGFADEPLTWSAHGDPQPQPPSIQHCVKGRTLTITVTPPLAIVLDSFHFTIHFNNGKQIDLLTAHGLRPFDPTIIEKPPE